MTAQTALDLLTGNSDDREYLHAILALAAWREGRQLARLACCVKRSRVQWFEISQMDHVACVYRVDAHIVVSRRSAEDLDNRAALTRAKCVLHVADYDTIAHLE